MVPPPEPSSRPCDGVHARGRRGARSLACALGGLAALAAPGLSAEPLPEAAPPCTSVLDVHVVDAVSHEPIGGATVVVSGQHAGETDARGKLLVRDACPGELLVEAERVDYALGQLLVTLGARATLELELVSSAEVILIQERAPRPTELGAATVIAGEALARTRGKPFTEALAEVPGVAPLGSSTGLAKPIIRGQYGRRLLVLVDGVRHRAQEWGLDHAPEIDPFVADRLTVVRGAAGVRFGPDAIGGAVLVDPPELRAAPGHDAEVHLVGNTNPRGGTLAGRVRVAPDGVPGLAWLAEATLRRHAAQVSPGYPLDNTASADGSAGATIGYRRGDYESLVSYRRYQARLGVCSCLRMDSAEEFFAQLGRGAPPGAELYRADFAIDRAYQEVAHDLALARMRWTWGGVGTVRGTYAFQHDVRDEYDVVRMAVTGPQFHFRLFTHDLELALDHRPIHIGDHLHLRGSVGAVGLVQTQRYSGLPLVPAYQAAGAGVYAIERAIGHHYELEAGVRYDVLGRRAALDRRDFLRLVRSGQLADDACGGAAGSDPVRCGSTFHMLSASLGGLVRITPEWAVKLDVSTATRPPSPDEQYLNGSAPTFPVIGLGKPDLGAETTYGASLSTTVEHARLAGELSAYANRIADYIYFAPALDPTGEPIFDVTVRGAFPRFVTRPVDAVFYGVDGGFAARPLDALELSGQFSVVRARNTRDDAYLVFVPPDRVRGAATYRRATFAGARDAYVSLSGSYVARQDRFDLAADLAPPPPAYFLLGAAAGLTLTAGPRRIDVAVVGANLLDARYRDYTSLLRYFADQPGTSVLIRLTVHETSSGSRS
jgi:iron complex outermembrane recepter protein